MAIRKAVPEDLTGIKSLLDQLEYPGTESFLASNIQRLTAHPDEVLLVYEGPEGVAIDEYKILAFISLHFIPQIALPGDFARISYFSVDESARGQGIGKEMETYCTKLARERGCNRLEVHCHQRRISANHFYSRQGYQESPRYLVKLL